MTPASFPFVVLRNARHAYYLDDAARLFSCDRDFNCARKRERQSIGPVSCVVAIQSEVLRQPPFDRLRVTKTKSRAAGKQRSELEWRPTCGIQEPYVSS